MFPYFAANSAPSLLTGLVGQIRKKVQKHTHTQRSLKNAKNVHMHAIPRFLVIPISVNSIKVLVADSFGAPENSKFGGFRPSLHSSFLNHPT